MSEGPEQVLVDEEKSRQMGEMENLEKDRGTVGLVFN
jgi:hypothetical protein